MAKINQKDFKCQICGKTFFTRIFLDEHKKIKHKNQDLELKLSRLSRNLGDEEHGIFP